jgi:hypothetical protein
MSSYITNSPYMPIGYVPPLPDEAVAAAAGLPLSHAIHDDLKPEDFKDLSKILSSDDGELLDSATNARFKAAPAKEEDDFAAFIFKTLSPSFKPTKRRAVITAVAIKQSVPSSTTDDESKEEVALPDRTGNPRKALVVSSDFAASFFSSFLSKPPKRSAAIAAAAAIKRSASRSTTPSDEEEPTLTYSNV